MRGVVWLVLLFAAAVVAALTLGDNDGLVSFFWGGRRIDLSLNLFLLLALAAAVVVLLLMQALNALLTLPRRAGEWRALQRERAAHAALKESLVEYFGGRYSRAHKAAQRALTIQADTGRLADDDELRVIARLLAASSLHRLQDRPARDGMLRDALDAARRGSARAVADGARLLGAEWALDDQDVDRAESLLAELPPGVARRTQALRLRMRAARMARQPVAALHTARLLAHHQAFSKSAALGLVRSLAFEVLDGTHDADQLRQAWQAMEAAERADPFVAAHAARRAVALQSADDARHWLRPMWDRLGELSVDARTEVALALAGAAAGIGHDWLPRLEAAQADWPQDPAVQAAVGAAYAERGLWGKARRPLEAAASHADLQSSARRRAWTALAALARQEGDNDRAARCERAGLAIET
jgi:HemY protein